MEMSGSGGSLVGCDLCVVCGDRCACLVDSVTSTRVLRVAVTACHVTMCLTCDCLLQGERAPLRRGELRGLQGLLQAVDEEGPGLPVPPQQGLRRQQELPQPVPVLQAAEVPRHGHALRQ